MGREDIMTPTATQMRIRTAGYLYILKVFKTTRTTSLEPSYKPIKTT